MSKHATCGSPGNSSASAFSTATAGGLCSGASGYQRLDARERRGVHQRRRGQIRAAMHHAMAEPDQAAPLEWPVRQGGQHRQRGRMILGGHHSVMHRLAIGGGDQQAALAADPLHFAALGAVRRSVRHAVHRELQAG